jgi:hypothetical protein
MITYKYLSHLKGRFTLNEKDPSDDVDNDPPAAT